ncbi:hypothetical protein HZS_6213 [Henneguya salminicola]|nr:hypothetical protein HZS_6213 [Henneguya salminicola]
MFLPQPLIKGMFHSLFDTIFKFTHAHEKIIRRKELQNLVRNNYLSRGSQRIPRYDKIGRCTRKHRRKSYSIFETTLFSEMKMPVYEALQIF